MNERDCYLWLSSINGIGVKTIEKLSDHFGSLLGLWSASHKEVYNIPNIPQAIKKNIVKHMNLDYLKKYKNRLKELNIEYTTKIDTNYPDTLSHIYNPPHILYTKGQLDYDIERSIAIVGSRKATALGKNIAYKFAYELAKEGITIISGMAYGIDSQAHKGAIDAKGTTYAVLGCGVDICYPKSNYSLMNEIINNGAVLSEFPLGTPPIAGNFPQRNRIISGLSKGILVVEAGLNSGSLITVDYGLEQGKNIYSIPGSIKSSASKGTNKLIKEGAKPVTSVEDILEDYNNMDNYYYNNYNNNIEYELSEMENRVYTFIQKKQPVSIELLVSIIEIDMSTLNSVITILEIKGLIEQLPGNILVTC